MKTETLRKTKEQVLPEKLIYQVVDGISTITCDGVDHHLNASHGRRLTVGKCDCAVWK